MSFYEEKPGIKTLITELNQLQKVYDQVKIEFQYNDPKTKQDDNGLLIVDDNTSTKITFTKNNLSDILQ